MADVVVSSVTKRFGSVTALDNVSLSIADGEFVALLGPTGVGKTTTLRVIAGLETPDSGQVSIGGVDVTKAPPAARDVAFVFQQYSLYPHLTVFDNLAFPLRSPLRPMGEADINTRVREVAGLLAIEDKLQNPATRLSGGQMQRVAIGRALVRSPSIFLMDEPLSSLDAKLRADLRLELKHIQQDLGATVLYVTHDQIEAMTMATRIGVLDAGRLVQVGTPREVYTNPLNSYVATRLGSPGINLVPRAAFPELSLPPSVATLGARTEHVQVAKAKDQARGTIRWVEHLGDQNHLHIEMDGHNLITLVDPDAPLDVGETVAVTLKNPLCFDADGNRVRL